jgi:hypothetical protein
MTKKRAAALFKEVEVFVHIPFELKYLKLAWASFYLVTGLAFLQETSIRSVRVLLYEAHAIPLWTLPSLYLMFALLLVIWYFRGWQLRYIETLIIWCVPMWAHLLAAYEVGIPWPSRVVRWWVIILFVWMAHDTEHNHNGR